MSYNKAKLKNVSIFCTDMVDFRRPEYMCVHVCACLYQFWAMENHSHETSDLSSKAHHELLIEEG